MLNKELLKKNFHNVVGSQKELNWMMGWGMVSLLCGVFEIPFIPSFIGLTMLIQLFFMGVYPETRFSRFSVDPSYFSLMALYRPLWISCVVLVFGIGTVIVYGAAYV